MLRVEFWGTFCLIKWLKVRNNLGDYSDPILLTADDSKARSS